MKTKDEFEKGYAERSGVTVEWLHKHDQFAFPCDCGEDGCKGWQMIHRADMIEYREKPIEVIIIEVIIKAKPMRYLDFMEQNNDCLADGANPNGYYVINSYGSESWTPKDYFEEKYEIYSPYMDNDE